MRVKAFLVAGILGSIAVSSPVPEPANEEAGCKWHQVGEVYGFEHVLMLNDARLVSIYQKYKTMLQNTCLDYPTTSCALAHLKGMIVY
jgi:hypothetical protein